MRSIAVALALASTLAAGCGDDAPRLHVFAASSLTEAFGELAERFGPEEVSLTFAGSQVLRLQIEQGAPADVFASADPAHVRALERAGHVARPLPFAEGELVIVVPQDNPAAIRSLADLRRPHRLVLANRHVPVGAYAREVLRRADADDPGLSREVLSRVVSEEGNARLVRAKVELGEADAAIVYRTDAVHSERVHVVELPAAVNVRARYVMVTVTGSTQSARAARWRALLLSDDGQAVLARHGFAPVASD